MRWSLVYGLMVLFMGLSYSCGDEATDKAGLGSDTNDLTNALSDAVAEAKSYATCVEGKESAFAEELQSLFGFIRKRDASSPLDEGRDTHSISSSNLDNLPVEHIYHVGWNSWPTVLVDCIPSLGDSSDSNVSSGGFKFKKPVLDEHTAQYFDVVLKDQDDNPVEELIFNKASTEGIVKYATVAIKLKSAPNFPSSIPQADRKIPVEFMFTHTKDLHKFLCDNRTAIDTLIAAQLGLALSDNGGSPLEELCQDAELDADYQEGKNLLRGTVMFDFSSIPVP